MGVGMTLENASRHALSITERVEKRSAFLRELRAPSDLRARTCSIESRLKAHLEILFEMAGEPQEERSSGVVLASPDLYAFALDNADVGCFGEVLLFTQQVRALGGSVPPRVVEVLNHLVAVAIDDAGLCWDIHDWCAGQLSPQRGRNLRAVLRQRWASLGPSVEGILGETEFRELAPRIASITAAA